MPVKQIRLQAITNFLNVLGSVNAVVEIRLEVKINFTEGKILIISIFCIADALRSHSCIRKSLQKPQETSAKRTFVNA